MIWNKYLYLKIFYPQLVRIQNTLRKTGYLKGGYQWVRHYEIIQLFKKYKPMSICELGCGASTGMFALLIKQSNRNIRFNSYEENESWCDNTLKAIGDISIFVDLQLVSKITENDVCFYDIDHDEDFDFVYVDGPYNDIDGVLLPCVDVGLMWNNGVFPRIVAVHIRTSTVDYLKNHIGFKNYVYSSFGDHSIFIRKKK